MKRKLGIKAKLLLSFLSFSLVVIILLITLEVVLFSDVFRSVRIKNLRNVSDELAEAQWDSIDAVVTDLSNRYDVCISIYSDQFSFMAGQHAGGQCVIHTMSKDTAELFYETTEKQSGQRFESYLTADEIREIQEKNREPEHFFHEFHSLPEGDVSSVFSVADAADCVLISRISTNSDGDEIFLLLSAVITPVDSTVSAIRDVLLIVGVVLVLGSIIMAVILSRIISKPIVKLNYASKSLPKGKFENEDIFGYREVEELSETLSLASKEIEKTEHLRKELIANVSHDLRTPLTLISGYSEVMRDLPGENTPENLQTIIDESHRLSELVTDLMDLSQLDSDTYVLNKSRLEVRDFLNNCIKNLEKMSAINGHNIRLEIHFDHAYILADEIKLQRVVQNLVINAMNYCGEDRFIGVRASIFNGNVLFEVIDHGKGIPPEKLDRIWERYYRVKESSSGRAGSGLGLSIVKKILDLHDACFGVESYQGIGSRFWFTFSMIE